MEKAILLSTRIEQLVTALATIPARPLYDAQIGGLLFLRRGDILYAY